MMIKHKKRISAFILLIALCFTLSSISFATEAPQKSPITITYIDKNGKSVSTTVNPNETVEIPIYSNSKETDSTVSANSLVSVATLTFGRNLDGFAYWRFTPKLPFIGLGFSGTCTTYNYSGLFCGTYDYELQMFDLIGTQTYHGTLDGTYYSANADPAPVFISYTVPFPS